MQGRADGFTIIEVTIFLAISGLLLLMMFIGTGSLAARQRFSDTTDNLQAYFQAQYEEVVNGVNVRNSGGNECTSDNPLPGKSGCLLLGKLLTVSSDGSTITSSYVISTQTLTTAQLTHTDLQKLADSQVKTVTTGQSTYELKWGAQVLKSTRSGASGRSEVNSIGFLRLPDSNRIVQVYYRSTSGMNYTEGLQTALSGDTAALNPRSYSDTEPSLAVCLKNDSDFAAPLQIRSAVKFGQGTGAGSMTTDYNPGALCQ